MSLFVLGQFPFPRLPKQNTLHKYLQVGTMGSTQMAGGTTSAYSEMFQKLWTGPCAVFSYPPSVFWRSASRNLAFAQQPASDGETIDLDTVTVTATRADRPLQRRAADRAG